MDLLKYIEKEACLGFIMELEMQHLRDKIQSIINRKHITRLKQSGYISLESVESICHVMNCDIDDILEYVPEVNHEAKGV